MPFAPLHHTRTFCLFPACHTTHLHHALFFSVRLAVSFAILRGDRASERDIDCGGVWRRGGGRERAERGRHRGRERAVLVKETPDTQRPVKHPSNRERRINGLRSCAARAARCRLQLLHPWPVDLVAIRASPRLWTRPSSLQAMQSRYGISEFIGGSRDHSFRVTHEPLILSFPSLFPSFSKAQNARVKRLKRSLFVRVGPLFAHFFVATDLRSQFSLSPSLFSEHVSLFLREE